LNGAAGIKQIEIKQEAYLTDSHTKTLQ